MSSGRTSSRPAPYASRAHSGSSPSGRNEVCEPVVPITSTFFLRSMEHCKRASTRQGPVECQAVPREKERHEVRRPVSNRTAPSRQGWARRISSNQRALSDSICNKSFHWKALSISDQSKKLQATARHPRAVHDGCASRLEDNPPSTVPRKIL